MSIETIQRHPLFFDEIIGRPDGNDCWVNGVNNATPWRILERRVAESLNVVQIIQATGEEWWVSIVGVKSGNTQKAVVKVACAVSYSAYKKAEKSEYESGELVQPFGVTADFFFGIAMLSKAELFAMARPMASLAEMSNEEQPKPPPVDESKAAQEADELSAKIAIGKQEQKKLSDQIFELKNEVAHTQTLLLELTQDVGVQLLADADNYSFAAYPAVPKPLFEIKDVQKFFKKKSGIYFGFKKTTGVVMYIGRSDDLANRVHAGRKELKDCRIGIIQMPDWETHTAELGYIAALRPSRNAVVNKAFGGRNYVETPPEYLTIRQAREYIARRTYGSKTVHDAILDGIKVREISTGRELIAVSDLQQLCNGKWLEKVCEEATEGKEPKIKL